MKNRAVAILVLACVVAIASGAVYAEGFNIHRVGAVSAGGDAARDVWAYLHGPAWIQIA